MKRPWRDQVTCALMDVFRMLPLPPAALRLCARLLFLATGSGEPRQALTNLLYMCGDLEKMLDITAQAYGNGVHVKHRLTRYHNFFTDRIGQGERVLDIGCGNGTLTHDLVAVSGAVATGIDIDADKIAYAREHFRCPGLRFACGDARDESLAAVDTVVLSNVLEHIEERVVFLRSVMQRHRPSRLLVRVPMIDRHWHVPLRQELGLFSFSDAGHFTEYTTDSFVREMSESGLIVSHLQVNWGEIWAVVEPR